MTLAYQELFDSSAALAMPVAIFLFLILFESRLPRKLYLATLIPFIVLWIGVNLYLLVAFGPIFMGRWMLLTATLPSLIFLLLVAKNRGGRFFFTSPWWTHV